ncbi:glycerate kinase [Frankia sp. ArI3]|uniref:glycerate kinase n=1 Tax=Frankia sp. ArI3 TaxID=1858 RepID=UPI000B225352|nr:glycerate kinase [Frankia sp. ArI3]
MATFYRYPRRPTQALERLRSMASREGGDLAVLSIVMDQAGTEIARPRGYRPGPSASGAVEPVPAVVEASVVLGQAAPGKAALGSPALGLGVLGAVGRLGRSGVVSTVGALFVADVRVLAACHGTEAQGTGAPAAGVSGTVLGLGGFTAIADRPAGEPTRRLAMSGNPASSWNTASAAAQASEHADRHLISGSARDPLPD